MTDFFDLLRGSEKIKSRMHEVASRNWSALDKWRDEVLVQDGQISSCTSWRPGQQGFIALDSVDPNLRNKILCGVCMIFAIDQMKQVGLENDMVCHMCGIEPEDHHFADIIVDLSIDVILVGHACRACLSTQISAE